MKYGIKISIDVTKIDKSLLYQGKKGTYLDAVVFMDPDNPGQYGDHGGIQQDLPKDRKDAGEKGAYIGNVKVFWTDGQSEPGQREAPQNQPAPQGDFDDTDLPF